MPCLKHIDGYDCLCVPATKALSAGAVPVCYLISPVAVDPAVAGTWARHRDIVIVSGTDWNNDMTPWPEPGIVHGKDDFVGNADRFLDIFRERIIPECEHDLNVGKDCVRSLAGLSLSGLFALYAWLSCEDFTNIGSISGSFWYEGFTDWFESRRPVRKTGCAYFSLGEKEGKGGNPRFSGVREKTESIIAGLRKDGVRTMFETTQGSHFTPFIPRMDLLLEGLAKMESGDQQNSIPGISA